MEKSNQLKRNFEEFYKDASDWAYDMYQSTNLWLKRSIKLNIILVIILFISIVMNCSLFPLKQKVPYLYTFNNSTGEISILGELKTSQIDNNWEMERFFLRRYVTNREMYDYDNVQYPYQIAWAMSSNNVRNEYDKLISSDDAPYKKYGKEQVINVHILSVSKLSNYTASVRFEKSLTDRTSGVTKVSQEEAIIKWNYENKPQTQEMLDRDPLGFKVIYYRVSEVNLNT